MSAERRLQERELLHRYATGERSFTDLDLDDRTYDFSFACLVGTDFSRCFIVANFAGPDLTDARFVSANVKTCDFRGANLSGASFEGAAIDTARFEAAQLEGASFAGASEQGHVYGERELPYLGA